MVGKQKKNIVYDIYYKELTKENLYKMWKIVNSSCKNKKDLYKFNMFLNININNIYNKLLNRTYKPSPFIPFLIKESKKRIVMNQTIEDKIVNHFVANYYLLKYLENSLIDTNVATRKEKGTSYLITKMKSYFNKIIINNRNKEVYVLKIDISKYFYSIEHEILLSMLKRKLKDQYVLELIEIMIRETNKDYVNEIINKVNNIYHLDIPFYINNKGLSIRAMASQFLAIYYLNDLDHYLKEKLRMKYYIRYITDLIILDRDKIN